MITLIWNSLALIGICSFPMWVMFVEGIVTLIAGLVRSGSEKDAGWKGTLLYAFGCGYIYYSVATMWLGVSMNGWFFLLAPVWFLAAYLIPGGLTISHLIFSATGLMVVPVWVWIVNGIMDLIMLASMLYLIAEKRKASRLAASASNRQGNYNSMRNSFSY